MTAGLKISLPGYDVKTCTPEQCAVHSEYPSPKIRASASPAHFGVTSYSFSSDPGNGTHNLLTIPHGYSYTPNAIVFVKDHQYSPARFSHLPTIVRMDFMDGYQLIGYYTDGTNLKVDYLVTNYGTATHANLTGCTFTFKYYIFVEDGTTFP